MRVADDYALVTKKAIEQTRFAGIGRAVNDHPDAFTKKAALIGGGKESLNFFANCVEAAAQFLAFVRFNALFREIDRRLDLGEERD